MENLNIKSQDIEKLGKNLSKIKKNYNYLFEDSSETNNFIDNIIKNNILKFSTEKNININILIKKTVAEIDEYISEIVSSEKKINSEGIKIITRFIDKKIQSDNIEELTKIEKLFNRINCQLDLEMCIKLLKENKKLNIIMTKYFKNNYDLIMNDELDLITNDMTKKKFIEAFCIVSKIEREKNNNKKLHTKKKNTNETVTNNIVKAYLKNNKKYQIKSAEEQLKLLHEIKKGNKEAFDILILSNYALVVYVAKRYVGKGVDLDDLIQIGTMGLIDAIKKFDETKETKFSTYAILWIRQKITRYIADNSRNIRIPDKKHFELQKLNQIKDSLMMKNGYMPPIDEIAKEMDLKIGSVIQLEQIENDTVSLNALVKSDSDTELEEFVEFDDDSLNNVLKPDIIDLFAKIKLTPRQIHMILLSNGFFNGKIYTLQEIGEYYGLTKERIRQIEVHTIRKIKFSIIKNELLSIIDIEEELTPLQMKQIKLINENDKKIRFDILRKYNIDKNIINKLLKANLNIIELEFIIPILGLGNCKFTPINELSIQYNVKKNFIYYMIERGLKKIDKIYDRSLFYNNISLNELKDDQVLKKILK